MYYVLVPHYSPTLLYTCVRIYKSLQNHVLKGPSLYMDNMETVEWIRIGWQDYRYRLYLSINLRASDHCPQLIVDCGQIEQINLIHT